MQRCSRLCQLYLGKFKNTLAFLLRDEQITGTIFQTHFRGESVNKNYRELSFWKNLRNILCYFCKLILLKDNELIGFISIFRNDCDECRDLTPWYSTMYVKKEYRGQEYSKILNDAILKESKKRNYKEIFLKTKLNNYYEKFGAKFIKKLNNGENLYKFEL